MLRASTTSENLRIASASEACNSLPNVSGLNLESQSREKNTASPPTTSSGFPKSERQNVSSDWLKYYTLGKETERYLDCLAKQVREGIGVDEAANFGRWLQFSGVVEILEPYAQEIPMPLRPGDLRRKMTDLIYECGDWYSKHAKSNRPRDAYVSQSKLDALEMQMARMAEQLEKLSPAAEVAPLRVIGGNHAG